MPQSIMAIYEHGLLRPLEPLVLPESQKVRILVQLENPVDTIEQKFQFLINTGQLTPPSGLPKVKPVSKAERRRVARILGKASQKPVSEMIIEDRGE